MFSKEGSKKPFFKLYLYKAFCRKMEACPRNKYAHFVITALPVEFISAIIKRSRRFSALTHVRSVLKIKLYNIITTNTNKLNYVYAY